MRWFGWAVLLAAVALTARLALPVVWIAWTSRVFNPFPFMYRTEPLQGRVIDALTREPVAGAKVVARWRLQYWPEGIPVEDLAVIEAVADAEGRFAFAWERPHFRRPGQGFLKDLAPRVLVFKGGYRYMYFTRNRFGQVAPEEFYDGNLVTVPLTRFTGSPDDYSALLSDLERDLSDTHPRDACVWKAYPSVLAELDAEARRLKGIGHLVLEPHTMDEWEGWSRPKACGSISEYVRQNAQ